METADFDFRVHGRTVDAQTRCVHYRGPLDVVAMRLDCCAGFWPCHACHDELAGHPARRVPRADFGLPRVLCGVCCHVLSVHGYRASDRCPQCAAPFNPGCATHAHLYFDVDGEDAPHAAERESPDRPGHAADRRGGAQCSVPPGSTTSSPGSREASATSTRASAS